jgi:hypothetical protein
MKTIIKPFEVGDHVVLKLDVLQRHSRSVPPQVGYTTGQFAWRETLQRLNGQIGTIERLFDKNLHVNVKFADGTLLGINRTELQHKTDFDRAMKIIAEEAAA